MGKEQGTGAEWMFELKCPAGSRLMSPLGIAKQHVSVALQETNSKKAKGYLLS